MRVLLRQEVSQIICGNMGKEESCACTSAYLADQIGGAGFLDLTASDSVSVNWMDKSF
jgi:hypothetical protein